MDLQLLAVVGTKMPLHNNTSSYLQLIGQGDEAGNQSLDKTDSENDIWPISEKMLRKFAIK